MQLEIELDNDSVEKLAYIQKQINQDVNDVIKQAIQQYYNQIQTNEISALTLFRELGLVGCIQGDPDLSVNYKTKLFIKAKS